MEPLTHYRPGDLRLEEGMDPEGTYARPPIVAYTTQVDKAPVGDEEYSQEFLSAIDIIQAYENKLREMVRDLIEAETQIKKRIGKLTDSQVVSLQSEMGQIGNFGRYIHRITTQSAKWHEYLIFVITNLFFCVIFVPATFVALYKNRSIRNFERIAGVTNLFRAENNLDNFVKQRAKLEATRTYMHEDHYQIATSWIQGFTEPSRVDQRHDLSINDVILKPDFYEQFLASPENYCMVETNAGGLLYHYFVKVTDDEGNVAIQGFFVSKSNQAFDEQDVGTQKILLISAFKDRDLWDIQARPYVPGQEAPFMKKAQERDAELVQELFASRQVQELTSEFTPHDNETTRVLSSVTRPDGMTHELFRRAPQAPKPVPIADGQIAQGEYNGQPMYLYRHGQTLENVYLNQSYHEGSSDQWGWRRQTVKINDEDNTLPNTRRTEYLSHKQLEELRTLLSQS